MAAVQDDARSGDTDRLAALLAQGADPNGGDEPDGRASRVFVPVSDRPVARTAHSTSRIVIGRRMKVTFPASSVEAKEQGCSPGSITCRPVEHPSSAADPEASDRLWMCRQRQTGIGRQENERRLAGR